MGDVLSKMKEADNREIVRLLLGCGWLILLASLHKARAQLCDDGADDVNKRAKEIEDGGEKGLEHMVRMVWVLWLRVGSVPLAALVLKFAARAVHAR
jgi:hypothetical protein